MMNSRQLKTATKARWKKTGAGRLALMAEHIMDEPELAAQVIRIRHMKWKVVLWSWGSNDPEPVRFDGDWARYSTAKKAKAAAEQAFLQTL